MFRPAGGATLDEIMGRRRYQRPSVLKRTDVARPYWYVRARVDVRARDGSIRRTRKSLFLGYCPTTTDVALRAEREEVTKREAERQRDTLLAGVNRQAGPIGSDLTLGEFVATHWLPRHVETLGSGTAAKYRSHLRVHLLPRFSALKLDAVTAAKIQDMLNDLAAAGRSWHTRTDILVVLSSCFTKAGHWGLFAGRNPCEVVEVGRKRLARTKRILTPAETALLVEALPELPRLLVEVCDATGCRISEALGLREKAIDFPRRGQALIAQRWYRGDLDECKSESSRRVVSLGAAADALRERLKGDPERFIFARADGLPFDDRDLLRWHVRPALKALGLWTVGLGWHSFRRKAITEWQAAGASSIEAAKMAGHGRPSVTHDYTVLDEQRAEELARRRRIQ